MTDLMKWTLGAIREGDGLTWMEDRRIEWSPLFASRIKFLFEGYTFIIITDDDREWFERYFLRNINRKDNSRPILPFVSLRSLYPSFAEINSKEEINLLEDMLSIAFPNGFIYFYIGKTSAKISQIAKGKDDSYMWLFDEQAQNSFYLSSNDEILDIKLISLFKLFSKSIDAVLFGKVCL